MFTLLMYKKTTDLDDGDSKCVKNWCNLKIETIFGDTVFAI